VRVTLPLGKKVRNPLTALLLGDGKTLRIVSITLRIVSIYDPPYAIPPRSLRPPLDLSIKTNPRDEDNLPRRYIASFLPLADDNRDDVVTPA